MRHIEKPLNSTARSILDDAKRWMSDKHLSKTYSNFTQKAKLNDELRKEQKYICCYCQQRITQGNHSLGSHNEHFYPEDQYVDNQLDYENIFACCNRTQGFQKRFQYCGEYKSNTIIDTNLLLDVNCSQYFKYNSNGEILPSGPMNVYDDVIRNRERLTEQQTKALAMIEALNLNEEHLKNRRKEIIDDIFAKEYAFTIEQLHHKIQVLHNEQNEYIEFVDLIIYYLQVLIRIKSHKQNRL